MQSCILSTLPCDRCALEVLKEGRLMWQHFLLKTLLVVLYSCGSEVIENSLQPDVMMFCSCYILATLSSDICAFEVFKDRLQLDVVGDVVFLGLCMWCCILSTLPCDRCTLEVLENGLQPVVMVCSGDFACGVVFCLPCLVTGVLWRCWRMACSLMW